MVIECVGVKIKQQHVLLHGKNEHGVCLSYGRRESIEEEKEEEKEEIE
jgi:hypothetical protein